jgi:hypothetical protein
VAAGSPQEVRKRRHTVSFSNGFIYGILFQGYG